MNETKNFKSYHSVTGAVDGTLAYDFGAQAYPKHVAGGRSRRQEKLRRQEWVQEMAEEEPLTAGGQSVSPAAIVGSICVVVLVVLLLLAQIQLVNASNDAAALESRITELEAERDKLTAAYETTFNLKEIEDYAVNELGMQTPGEEQVYYLTNVSAADRAVVITHEDPGLVSFGLEDILASLQAYFD